MLNVNAVFRIPAVAIERAWDAIEPLMRPLERSLARRALRQHLPLADQLDSAGLGDLAQQLRDASVSRYVDAYR